MGRTTGTNITIGIHQAEVGLSNTEREEIDELFHQLSPDAPRLSREMIRITAAKSVLVLMRDRDAMGRIIGIAVLSFMCDLDKVEGYVNTVVVHSDYRGLGLGNRLMEFVEQKAWDNDCTRMKLTSQPKRAAAHALYKKRGWKVHNTTVFRLTRPE